MVKKSVITKSPGETITLGKRIGRRLISGNVVLLYGELGSGKTVLIKGICLSLKVKGIVKSPSFVIINEYQGEFPVYHIDLYRLKKKEAAVLGLDEYFYYQDGITLVEWADRLAAAPKSTTLKIFLKHSDSMKRSITIHDFRH